MTLRCDSRISSIVWFMYMCVSFICVRHPAAKILIAMHLDFWNLLLFYLAAFNVEKWSHTISFIECFRVEPLEFPTDICMHDWILNRKAILIVALMCIAIPCNTSRNQKKFLPLNRFSVSEFKCKPHISLMTKTNEKCAEFVKFWNEMRYIPWCTVDMKKSLI